MYPILNSSVISGKRTAQNQPYRGSKQWTARPLSDSRAGKPLQEHGMETSVCLLVGLGFQFSCKLEKETW